MKDMSPREVYEHEYRKAKLHNIATNYGKKLFELNGSPSREVKLHILGNQLIISEALHSLIKISFPWRELKAFTPSTIVLAAKQAGFTVYDSAHPSPYLNIQPELDEYAIVWFEEDINSESAKKKQEIHNTLKARFRRLFNGDRVNLESKFSVVYLPDEALTPHLTMYLAPPNIVHIEPINLGSRIARTHGYVGDIYEKVLKELGYTLPSVELPEDFSFLEQEALEQSSKIHKTYQVLNHFLANRADGIYFLASETTDET